MKGKVYQILAGKVDAVKNCRKTGNAEWEERHLETIRQVEENYLPHGSGFDAGVKVDIERTSKDKLVLVGSYHVMEEGYYVGWIDFVATVKPLLTLAEIDVVVKGPFGKYQDVKEYIGNVLYQCLVEEIALD
jgi:hypothetical protein